MCGCMYNWMSERKKDLKLNQNELNKNVLIFHHNYSWNDQKFAQTLCRVCQSDIHTVFECY